ncbi:MAG: BrnT family toxin [Magnetococcales bacterium]|nr:BrnT family toxin [Magnetococcales bacterium]
MKIDFDPVKDAINLAKHGVSLEAATGCDWSVAIAKPDQRSDYGEKRMIGYAPIRNRLYCIVFVDRGGGRRVISLRKANSREVRVYVQSSSILEDSDT